MTRTSLSLSELPSLPPSKSSLVSVNENFTEAEGPLRGESFELRNIEAALELHESVPTPIAAATASVFEQSLPPVDGGRAAWSFVSKHTMGNRSDMSQRQSWEAPSSSRQSFGGSHTRLVSFWMLI